MNLPQNGGRQRKVSQAAVQFRTKGLHHHNPEYRDRKDPGYARDGIVDSRSRADMVWINRVHNDSSEWSYRYGCPKPQDNDRRQECLPIAFSHGRQREQSKPNGNNEWTSDQRNSGPIPSDKSARPAGEKEHQQDERK